MPGAAIVTRSDVDLQGTTVNLVSAACVVRVSAWGDRWWPVEVDRFDVGDAPHRALDRESDGRPRAELTVIADPERGVAESHSYRALVGRMYEAACDARTQALPEIREIRAERGEGFDRIEATQAPRDAGSVLPKSFNLSTAAGDRGWVAPNATKHVWEETRD